MRPRGSVLLREVDVGLRDLRGEHEPVVLLASGFPQLLRTSPVRASSPACRAHPRRRRSRCARRGFPSTRTPRSGSGRACAVLPWRPRASADRAFPRIAAVDEVTRSVPLPRASIRGHTADARRNKPERAHAPACLEGLGRRVLQRSIADLGAQVVDDDFDRADLGLDGGHARSSMESGSMALRRNPRRRTSVARDRVDQLLQSVRVAAPTQTLRDSPPGRSVERPFHQCPHQRPIPSKRVSCSISPRTAVSGR